jgi:hypothetical protein
MRKVLAFLFLSAISAPSADSVRGSDASDVAAAARSITSPELKRYIDILADDTFEGRETGSRGGQASANYLAKAFETAGLKPAGDKGSYFQAFNGRSRNILGLLEGSDPKLKNEVIIFGAHYDHVGYGRANNSFGPFGYIHNGADDNASGVSGLLEVVDAFKQLPVAPKRSILFALWDGEEAGLLGSKHWLASPTVPLDRVLLKINVDMIGRLTKDRVEVFGSRTSANLRQLISRANTENPLELDFTWKMKADSDHYPFFERSIPTLMFHTGLHKDYHRPSDDAHLINNEGVERVARLCFLTLEQLADMPERPAFRAAARQENVISQAKLEAPGPAPQSRFGIGWKKNAEDGQLSVVQLVRGAPAERSGIQVGDKLVSFNGEPVENQDRFHLQLLAASGPTIFKVQRRGEQEPREISITPAGSPVRVGFTWRQDDAEPRSAVVTQVIGGSAADQAGLRHKDRVYAVNDQPFSTGDEFAALLKTPGPLKLLVERSGRPQDLDLKPLDPTPAP